jgi:hypothetical protein
METTNTTKTTGAFEASLKRNNQKIREDRAKQIVTKAELTYRREIEDLETELQELQSDRENMLDLSPTSADSLTMAGDFDAKAYVAKDVALGLKIRNIEITLEVARKNYAYLFGGS